MPIYYTTSAPCRHNNAIVIGGVNTAAKRRIQRKALHSCRKVRPTPTPAPDCQSDCCKSDCATKWPNCVSQGCCGVFLKTAADCNECINGSGCTSELRPTPPEHNCNTKEVWTARKTDWCCKHKDLGCPKDNAY